VAFTFLLLLCIVSALGVGSFFYIPSFPFWNWYFFLIKVWFKLTTFFFFFFFKLKKKKKSFPEKIASFDFFIQNFEISKHQKKKKNKSLSE